jgi:hypothetical protein
VDYSSCSILMSDYLLGKAADGSAKFDIEYICSVEGVAQDATRKICEEICESETCCFESVDECNADCCKNLQQNSYPKPEANLAATCNIPFITTAEDSFYEDQCLDLCKPAECCRDDTCRDIDE